MNEKEKKKKREPLCRDDLIKGVPAGLKRLRNELGLTQAAIAEKIGVDIGTYGRYETGKIVPPLDVLLWFANECDCSFDYVIGKDDCRSVDNQYMQDVLGLSDNSLSAIKHNNKHNPADINILDFICNLQGGRIHLHFLLSYIRSYITGEYNTPVQYDPNTKKHIIPYWQNRDNLMYFARDRDNLQDVIGLPLYESLSETTIINGLRKLLDELKNDWKRKG